MYDTTILTAVLAFAGTLIGTLYGIKKSSSLANYKMDELTKRVDAHNHFDVRVKILEQEEAAREEQIKTIFNMISELKQIANEHISEMKN